MMVLRPILSRRILRAGEKIEEESINLNDGGFVFIKKGRKNNRMCR
jgi:hypothetical protein